MKLAENPQMSGQQLGRRARKALATRSALFDAGLTAFENRPIGVVSVLDLTEAADVAKGVFYLHFRSKDEYLIALWESVQRQFLDSLGQRLDGCPAPPECIRGAARHYYEMLTEHPRECRYWLRMASYFGEEIGRPGQMGGLRLTYRERLAALIAGMPPEDVGPRELRTAAVTDGVCWGLISQELQLDGRTLDEETFVGAVGRCLGPLGF